MASSDRHHLEPTEARESDYYPSRAAENKQQLLKEINNPTGFEFATSQFTAMLPSSFSAPKVLGSILAQICKASDHKILNQGALTKWRGWGPNTNNFSPIVCYFESAQVPGISVPDYVTRLEQWTKCTPECMIVALIYIDRLIAKHEGFLMHSLNFHRLYLTATMMATKFYEDSTLTNAFWAKVGGVSAADMNKQETQFSQMLGWDFDVSADVYQQYCNELVTYAEKNGLLAPALPLETITSIAFSAPAASAAAVAADFDVDEDNDEEEDDEEEEEDGEDAEEAEIQDTVQEIDYADSMAASAGAEFGPITVTTTFECFMDEQKVDQVIFQSSAQQAIQSEWIFDVPATGSGFACLPLDEDKGDFVEEIHDEIDAGDWFFPTATFDATALPPAPSSAAQTAPVQHVTPPAFDLDAEIAQHFAAHPNMDDSQQKALELTTAAIMKILGKPQDKVPESVAISRAPKQAKIEPLPIPEAMSPILARSTDFQFQPKPFEPPSVNVQPLPIPMITSVAATSYELALQLWAESQ